jgi:transcriptional regulator with XRE-family HTH domain
MVDAGLTNEYGEPEFTQLAQAAGVHPSNVARYARGETSPRMDTVAKLALALKVPQSTVVDWLDGGRIEKSWTYSPPSDAHLMTHKQRLHVDELIKMFVAANRREARLTGVAPEDLN